MAKEQFCRREVLNVNLSKIAGNRTVWLAGISVLALILVSAGRELSQSDTSFGDAVRKSLAKEICMSVYDQFVPMVPFMKEDTSGTAFLVQRQLIDVMPLYGYSMEWENSLSAGENITEQYLTEESMTEDNIIGQDTPGGYLTGEYITGENLTGEILTGEGITGESTTGEAAAGEKPMGDNDITENKEGATEEASLEELLQAENEAAMRAMAEQNMGQSGTFIPHALQREINPEELRDYETLVKSFYTIDSNTMAGSDQLDVTKLSGKDLTITKDGEGPQILIYHTHSQESFADSVPGDESTTIIGVGDRLAAILTEEYGYQVLHHTGKYDVDSRDDAYSKALPAIEQVLAENPSIQVVIDLHRDQMAEETRLVMDVDGRPTARFMFFNGLSRTRKTGNISYLYNANQEDNLAFSFQMQLKAEEYYPGLARKIYLKGYRYNMHLRPRSLLIELGAQNNTVEEAMNACDPIAHILDMVLSGQ